MFYYIYKIKFYYIYEIKYYILLYFILLYYIKYYIEKHIFWWLLLCQREPKAFLSVQ